MDVRMPRLDGIAATRRVVALKPDPPRVMLLTTFDLNVYVFDGLLAGASGFLCSTSRRIGAGETRASPAAAARGRRRIPDGSLSGSARCSCSWSAACPTPLSPVPW